MGMKYRDPNTGQLKELSLKAADTLPIGTIVDYDGETVPDGWEEYGTDDYSTEETFTGKHWIDGKPIYRKVIDFGSLPNNTTKYIPHNINNIDKVIKIMGYATEIGTKNFYPLPLQYKGADSSYNVEILINNNNVVAVASQDRSMYIAYVILEYTKTTD